MNPCNLGTGWSLFLTMVVCSCSSVFPWTWACPQARRQDIILCNTGSEQDCGQCRHGPEDTGKSFWSKPSVWALFVRSQTEYHHIHAFSSGIKMLILPRTCHTQVMTVDSNLSTCTRTLMVFTRLFRVYSLDNVPLPYYEKFPISHQRSMTLLRKKWIKNIGHLPDSPVRYFCCLDRKCIGILADRCHQCLLT